VADHPHPSGVGRGEPINVLDIVRPYLPTLRHGDVDQRKVMDLALNTNMPAFELLSGLAGWTATMLARATAWDQAAAFGALRAAVDHALGAPAEGVSQSHDGRA
jgi:hypothetical protein